MGIRANKTPDMNRYKDSMHRNIVRSMAYVGEKGVNHARSIPPEIGFNDDTGNLRSSIGYGMFHHGRDLLTYMPPSRPGTQKGVTAGKSHIDQIASRTTGGYTLIMVAGMGYAGEVEARGRDVLTTAERVVVEELNKAAYEIKKRVAMEGRR